MTDQILEFFSKPVTFPMPLNTIVGSSAANLSFSLDLIDKINILTQHVDEIVVQLTCLPPIV